jgi:hypothetical protein
MNVTFFDDPLEGPNAPDDVRVKQIGLFIHEDGRRVMVGFELTKFRERPSIEVIITNAKGILASSLSVIETLTPNFSLTMHLRDKEPTDIYHVKVIVYYATPETERQNVHSCQATFNITQPGEQIFPCEEE